MNGFFSNVEREQQSTARPEHSFEFQKCLRQFLRCEVNNRVEGGNGSAGTIRYFERQHVALKKLNVSTCIAKLQPKRSASFHTLQPLFSTRRNVGTGLAWLSRWHYQPLQQRVH